MQTKNTSDEPKFFETIGKKTQVELIEIQKQVVKVNKKLVEHKDDPSI